MKLFNIEISPQEIWEFIIFPFKKILEIKTIKRKNYDRFLDKITWEYKIPRFKLKKYLRKEDISDVRPLCRKCGCELRNDFSYPIKRTTYRVYKFTCPNCRLVHDVNAESLEDYFEDLVRRLAKQ